MSTSKREREKEYYLQNKEKIKNQKKEIVLCNFCKCQIVKGNMYKHKRTIKHKLLLENFNLLNELKNKK